MYGRWQEHTTINRITQQSTECQMPRGVCLDYSKAMNINFSIINLYDKGYGSNLKTTAEERRVEIH